jgi:hypothetical protein
MRRAIALTLWIFSLPALGCGYCVEDKVAAAYDHAVVAKALGSGRHVAFLHVDGAPARKALEQALARTAGIERGTARISADLLTVSFAYDPRRATLGAIHAALEKRLAPYGASLLPFRVIDKPGQLKEVRSAAR